MGSDKIGVALARALACKTIDVAIANTRGAETLASLAEELGVHLSSEVVSKAFVGARLVKAFKHLPAAQIGTNPPLEGQRQVVFISSNDADASATVAAVATQLGFAPIELGRLDQGGAPLHAVNGEPGGLLLQNVEKFVGENYE